MNSRGHYGNPKVGVTAKPSAQPTAADVALEVASPREISQTALSAEQQRSRTRKILVVAGLGALTFLGISFKLGKAARYEADAASASRRR